MEALMPQLVGIAPSVAALGLGWFLRQSVCSDTDGETAAKFALYITLPSLILQTFHGTSLPSLIPHVPAVALYSLSLAISALISYKRSSNLHPRERGLLSGISLGSAASLSSLALILALFPSPPIITTTLLCIFTDVIATHFISYRLFSTAGAAFPEQFEHLDGGRYRGEWKGMLKEGYGVYYYPSGARYEGQWREGLKEGRGVYHFPKGGLYEGEWKGGSMSGVGVRTFASGRVQSGVWEHGKLVTPMEEWQCALAIEGANEAAEVGKRVVVGGADLGTAARRLAMQPAFWACILAFILMGVGTSMTPAINSVTKSLASAHGPLAFLAFGMMVDTSAPSAKQMKDVSSILAARLIPPLLLSCTAAALAYYLNYPSIQVISLLTPALLCAVAPISSTALENAHIFRLNESLAAAATRASTLASLFLIPFLAVSAASAMNVGSVLPFIIAVSSAMVSIALVAALGSVDDRPGVLDERMKDKIKMVYMPPAALQNRPESGSTDSNQEGPPRPAAGAVPSRVQRLQFVRHVFVRRRTVFRSVVNRTSICALKPQQGLRTSAM